MKDGESINMKRIKEAVMTYERIRPRHLLTNHQPNRYERPPPIPRNQPHFLEQLPRGGFADQPAFHVELLGHILKLVADVRVVGVEAVWIFIKVSMLHSVCFYFPLEGVR